MDTVGVHTFHQIYKYPPPAQGARLPPSPKTKNVLISHIFLARGSNFKAKISSSFTYLRRVQCSLSGALMSCNVELLWSHSCQIKSFIKTLCGCQREVKQSSKLQPGVVLLLDPHTFPPPPTAQTNPPKSNPKIHPGQSETSRPCLSHLKQLHYNTVLPRL